MLKLNGTVIKQSRKRGSSCAPDRERKQGSCRLYRLEYKCGFRWLHFAPNETALSSYFEISGLPVFAGCRGDTLHGWTSRSGWTKWRIAHSNKPGRKERTDDRVDRVDMNECPPEDSFPHVTTKLSAKSDSHTVSQTTDRDEGNGAPCHSTCTANDPSDP